MLFLISIVSNLKRKNAHPKGKVICVAEEGKTPKDYIRNIHSLVTLLSTPVQLLVNAHF